MSNTQNAMNEQDEKKFNEWSQIEYIKIRKYCASKGYQIKKVDQPKSSVLAPIVAIWFVKTTEANTNLWVISGDFPTDLVNSDVAKNARQCLRHFSMSWHMQAANLEQGITRGNTALQDKETQMKLSQALTNRAEGLYKIYSDDSLWVASSQEA